MGTFACSYPIDHTSAQFTTPSIATMGSNSLFTTSQEKLIPDIKN
jgi:hypothetical protein